MTLVKSVCEAYFFYRNILSWWLSSDILTNNSKVVVPRVVTFIVIKYVLATWILENPKFADEIGARRIQPHGTNLDFKYFVW